MQTKFSKKSINVIAICSDTFRADHLGCYGNPWIKTPNLDRLAKEGIVFENAYAEGLPTIPARKVYFTGRRQFPRWEIKPSKEDPGLSDQPGWNPLKEDEISIAEILGQQGILTALITDVFHMFKPNQNLHRKFHSWQWIRGQESDYFLTGPKNNLMEKYKFPGEYIDESEFFKASLPGNYWEQYILNIGKRHKEEDYFVAQVMNRASEWVKDNKENSPFFLWVDCFDPHEPWDPPKEYADLYYLEYKGKDPIFASPGQIRWSAEEQKRKKSLYAGEVTLVDKWIGVLLNKVEEFGLKERTVILFTSDHGTMLGELGRMHKSPEYLIKHETQLPLIIYYPGFSQQGKRIKSFVQAYDFMPTILDMFDIPIPEYVDGKSIWPLVEGKISVLHNEVISAWSNYVSIRNNEWNLIMPYKKENNNEIKFLFDFKNDPGETTNVIEKYPDIAKNLEGLIIDYIKNFR